MLSYFEISFLCVLSPHLDLKDHKVKNLFFFFFSHIWVFNILALGLVNAY